MINLKFSINIDFSYFYEGGDYSEESNVLVQKLHLIFLNHKNWYNQQAQLIPFSIYSFLRVISGNGIDLGLRKELGTFCATVLIEKFKECSVIGRDLIRVLQDVSKMSEFTQVWKFLYQKSSQSSLNDSSIETTQLYKILQVPSPKRYLACRLTPEMEINLLFILDHVKYGGIHHRKYYDWFSYEYLKVSDTENLIIDIIRYLVVAYHPPNSVLASSSVQRWQIITWFLRQMKTNYSTANAKLALFYDWLFYDPAIDNIMNVEPAILIISKSASVNPKITSTMIEFLYLLKKDYLPTLAESIEKCIDKTMFDILSKRVISNLESILLSDQIGEDVKKQTKELFPCYINLHSLKQQGYNSINNNGIDTDELMNKIQAIEDALSKKLVNFLPDSMTFDLVQSLGTVSDLEFETCEKRLIDLIQVTLNNFNAEDEQIRQIAICMKAAFNSPKLDKDVIDRAIERISLLPFSEFSIETFLTSSPPLSKRSTSDIVASTLSISSGSSSCSSSSNESIKDVDMGSNDIEDKIRHVKISDSKQFYGNCFAQFYSELSELPNVIELIGVILEDTDPSQLFSLKNQLLIGSKNPLNLNWNNLTRSLSITKDWDGYCQIFLWDLLIICLKQQQQISDPIGGFKEILLNIKPALLIEENSEICNGIINLVISFYPKNNQINEYFNWLLLFLELGSESEHLIMSILTYYWRMNSRLFLQSLVKLDEEGPQKINQKQVKNTLMAFSKTISALEENSPAKKSLLSCVETTIALMSK